MIICPQWCIRSDNVLVGGVMRHVLMLWFGRPDVVNDLINSVVSDRKWELSSVSDLST